MKTLESVLRSYADPDLAALGERPKKALVVETLTAQLKGVVAENTKFFWVCVGMIVSLFIVQIVLVLTNLQNSAAAKAGTIVLGCSAAALIPKMIGLWQEKVRTEVLLALLPNVKPEMQQTLINILWKRLSSRGGSTPK